MKRVGVALVAFSALGMAAATAAPATHAPLSPGCQLLNDPMYDNYVPRGIMRGEFFEGEQISITGSEPKTAGNVTSLRLLANLVNTVDLAPFPGTLEYTIPAGGAYTFQWNALTDDGTLPIITWMVSCAAPADPLPTAKEQCMAGGWAAFGFKNQGDCVKFVSAKPPAV